MERGASLGDQSSVNVASTYNAIDGCGGLSLLECTGAVLHAIGEVAGEDVSVEVLEHPLTGPHTVDPGAYRTDRQTNVATRGLSDMVACENEVQSAAPQGAAACVVWLTFELGA